MKKRMLALLLTVLMVLSLLPVSALAAQTDELIGDNLTNGTFTDATADAAKSYTYTVKGSDGSVQTVSVDAVADDTDATTYGTIGTTTGTGATYYELVTNGTTGITAGNKYLIVSTNTGSGYALTKTAGAAEVTIANNRIDSVDSSAVFTLESNGNDAYYLKDSNGTYLFPYGGYIYRQNSYWYSTYPIYITGTSSVKLYTNYENMYSLTYSNQAYSCIYGTGVDLYLFHETTEPSGTVYQITWTDAAKTLLDECNDLKEDEYTSETWTEFKTALDAANTAYAAASFETETAANAALATMTTLAAAKAALEKVEIVYPEIEWKRTKELAYSQTGKGDLVTGLTFTAAGDENTYPTVFWNWSDVSSLTTDDTMEVWDYSTSSQYSDVTANTKIKAATWVHRNAAGTAKPSWSLAASVRKFAGTFVWPEGYDLDDTAALVSVNDSKYQAIYDYVANSGNEEYQKAIEGKYILPANDDIYVFMYADGTTLTEDNYMDYLVFWTGTSGKGVWSSSDNIRNADWGKTVPSTFNNIYANRSFHGVTPNLYASTDNTTEIKNLSAAITGWDSTLMNQSDGWYTFADTAGIAKVLKNNYSSSQIKTGTKMHIDIYCFDNDGIGGMDQLQLKLTRTPETHKSVEVRYYLDEVDSVDSEHYLGSTYMQDVQVGTTITLLSGTDANQLNHMKATAIEKANKTDVTDGEQVNALTVTENGNNVINVLYTKKTTKQVILLTADTAEVPYDGNPHTLTKVTITENGYTGTVETTNGTATLPDTHTINNAISEVTQTLPGIYTNNFKTAAGATPDISVKDGTSDITNSYEIHKIAGTLTITYQPASKTYTYDFGVSNTYSGVFADVEKNATITVPEQYQNSVKIDKDNNTITYTPDSVNTRVTVPLTLTFNGNYQVTKHITFLPESNVMYEESFVTTQGSSWQTEGTAATKKVTKHDDAYGYTDAYESDTTYSNASALKATVTQGNVTDAATFTFTGTGFDLISECGTDTGMLIVGVKDQKGTAKCAYVVDTYFCGDDGYVTGTGILDYQVPVVRNLGLTYGTYTVEVKGYLNVNSGAVSSNSGIATASLAGVADEAESTAAPTAEEILRAAGMSEYLDADIEVSYMDDNSVLNGGTGPETTAETKTESTKTGLFSRVRSFFSNLTGAQTASLDAEDSTEESTISTYIDAFRVYQPLETDPDAYEETEKGTKYNSLYDFVKTSVGDLDDYVANAAVYVEYDGETGIEAIADYKNQGPQNEVYLTPGSGIVFGLQGYEEGDTVQVSASQIGNVTSDIEDLASTGTEMYYDVTPVYDETLELYYVVISNDVGSTGILALSALKVSSEITAVASAALANQVIQAKTAENDAFKPEMLNVTAPTSTKVKRSYTIKVQSSTDVDHIVLKTPDEKEITLTATNRKAVAAGRAKTYTFSKSFKQTEAGNYNYTVTAFDSNGNASTAVNVTVTVTAQ